MRRFIAVCVCAVGLLVHRAARGLTIAPAPQRAPIHAFDKTTWLITADRSYSNPFDPDEAGVDAVFTVGGQQSITVPAFWYEPPTSASVPQERADAGWMVRFSPPAAGHWTVIATVRDASGTVRSSSCGFDVGASDAGGFLRRGPAGSAYFYLDNGKPLFLTGVDLCWSGRDGLAGYERLFGTFAKVGGNFTRLWMGSPRTLETRQAGLGRYDPTNAAYYDGVLDCASRHGLRVMLTLDDYRKLAETDYFGHTDWEASPYNVANGGPLQHPMEFFVNADARRLYRQRLRYLVARYSAFTSLGFWEFWNEQDNLPKPALPTAWMAEMAGYLRKIDPAQHLITTSYSWDDKPAVWQLSEMDLTQRHLYGAGDVDDFVSAVASDAQAYGVYNKPHLIGEFGITWKEPDIRFDPHGSGTSLHNACWAAMLSGDAGIPMSWWWDNYIEPKNLWHTYVGVCKFAAAVDWSQPWQRVEIPPAQRISATPPTFTDMVVVAGGGWGKNPPQPVTISGNGEATPALPGFIYGPKKAELGQKVTLRIDLPNDSQMRIHVDKVSQSAELRVGVDGVTAGSFAFNAAPGSPDVASTEQLPDSPGVYQAVIDKDFTVPLRAGRHTLVLENTAGDWLKIGSITFTNARSSLLVDLKTLGLQSRSTGATLAWLCDPRSTWKQDLAGVTAQSFAGLALDLPAPRSAGHCTVHWWDTRSGQVIAASQATAQAGVIHLTIPTFERDIAVQVLPQ